MKKIFGISFSAICLIIGCLFLTCTVQAINKDANDVAALQKLTKNINENNKVKVPTNLNDNSYKWDNKNGRLIGINFWFKDIKGELNFNSLTGLESINIGDTLINSIKINKLCNLKKLDCNNALIKKLDLSNCVNLEKLDCSWTRIKSLDLSKLSKLKKLNCEDCNLKTININNNVSLKDLDCSGNYLTELKINNLKQLQKLDCFDNKITELNIKKLKKLKKLSYDKNVKIIMARNKHDVKELKKLIRKLNKNGADIPKNVYSNNYRWDY